MLARKRIFEFLLRRIELAIFLDADRKVLLGRMKMEISICEMKHEFTVSSDELLLLSLACSVLISLLLAFFAF